MYLTVAICTWNRASLLDKTLSAMYQLEIPNNVEWELLVVNNNCSDNTDEVILKHQHRLPVRVLHEPQSGKSFALNHAVNEARGEYIIWTDDDALVEPGWVKAYHDAFIRWPKASIFGGPVEPWFEDKPPVWLRRVTHIAHYAYALVNIDENLEMKNVYHIPNGVNWAIRIDVQKRYLYDVNLGPRPNSALRGEEGEIMMQMIKDGIEGRWVPDAIVRHFIPQNRQSIKYLRSYYRGAGEYQALRVEDNRGVLWFGKPRWWWRSAFQKELKYRFNKIFRKPEIWIDDLIKASIEWGKLLGSGKKPVR